MEDYILETFDLCKSYQGRMVVDKVNMHIKKGDIYGFIGENGAGKTTIMRLITGLSPVTEGQFKLFGTLNTSKEINEKKKKIAGIVENVSFHKNFDALENLKIQCMIAGIKKTDEQLKELLLKVGLDLNVLKNRKVGNFSLGMRQRLGIAMVMINDPEFVLLDEPMNGLDPQGFIEMRETILKLNSEGVTFLISSHILSELEKTVNCVGFISSGKMLEELSIEELHKKARKKIAVEAYDNAKLEMCLNKLSLKEVHVDNNAYYIYDDVDINDIMNMLVKEDVKVKKINVLEDTIENYYINLIARSKI